MRRCRSGKGLLNRVIDKLPIELHIPGYKFCGPGTRLSKRLARGDVGINPLDEACKSHDIAYDLYSDLENRHRADRLLAQVAFDRVRAPDASVGEKLSALGVGTAMKAKTKLGMGNRVRRRRKRGVKKGGAIPFRKFIRGAWNVLKRTRPIDAIQAARQALNHLKQLGKNSTTTTPRIIEIPKTGGFLPLIPIFAGLSALGALSGGAAGIAKAVQDAKAAQQQLKESERHNKTMEAIAMGKGLYLKPYRKGLGLYLKPYRKGLGLRQKKKTSIKITKPSFEQYRSLQICKETSDSIFSRDIYA